MSKSVKEQLSPHFAAFFAGVDEARALLDRRSQDLAHRHQRLGDVTLGLLRPRPARELGRWLLRELAEALGANEVELRFGVPCGDELTLAHRDGALGEAAGGISCELTLRGLDGGAGTLRLKLEEPLAQPTLRLLEELLSTAAAALEQGLRRD